MLDKNKIREVLRKAKAKRAEVMAKDERFIKAGIQQAELEKYDATDTDFKYPFDCLN